MEKKWKVGEAEVSTPKEPKDSAIKTVMKEVGTIIAVGAILTGVLTLGASTMIGLEHIGLLGPGALEGTKALLGAVVMGSGIALAGERAISKGMEVWKKSHGDTAPPIFNNLADRLVAQRAVKTETETKIAPIAPSVTKMAM